MSSSETRGTYVFNMHSEKTKHKPNVESNRNSVSKNTFKLRLKKISRSPSNISDTSVREELDVEEKSDEGDVPRARKALIFAREQLLAELAKKDLNVFLLEGWRVTIMRKGRLRRIEVQYRGRGALAAGKPDIGRRPPPFMELLEV